MGCCSSSDTTEGPKGSAPKKTALEDKNDAETTPIVEEKEGVGSPERKSLLVGSVDTAAAVYVKETTNGSGYDTPGSLSILPPPSLKSRDETQGEPSSVGAGWRLLTPFEFQFCQTLNASRKSLKAAPLHISPGLVKTCRLPDKKDPSVLTRAAKHGRVGPSGLNELCYNTSPAPGNAAEYLNVMNPAIRSILLSEEYNCMGLNIVEGELHALLGEEFSDDDGEEGFVPWDVVGSSDVKMTMFEKQIFHEINLAREQPDAYRNILKRELANNVKNGKLCREGCLAKTVPNAEERYSSAIDALNGAPMLKKIEKTTVEAWNAARRHDLGDAVVRIVNEKTARGVVIQMLLDPVNRKLLLGDWDAVGIAAEFHPDAGNARRAAFIKFVPLPTAAKPTADDIKGTGASMLSPLEHQIFHELNEARTAPATYATYIAAYAQNIDENNFYCDPSGQKIILNEGKPAYTEAIAFLESVTPRQPFSEVPSGLQKAARDHADDSKSGLVGHTGTDGSTLIDRVSRYGTVAGSMAENVSFGRDTARGILIQLIVDEGVPGRGHRTNIFEPTFTAVGIAAGPHATYRDCCVLDFASTYTEKEN
eukprot:TRINITY_DN24263_c0_g1_i1.p1 TRINITY_DN24263_c0_g1~~TRINITY_DN24263_c0_g1_i1.p1  ORF type:complete len:593 (+),score=64.53 TRINITY_DN24263_c0_g1_i1:193-1971(+)